MQIFAFIIFISLCVFIPYVIATTCDECKATWDGSDKTCTDDDTYIKCLISAASTDAGCDTRYTKMKEAKTHRDALNCTELDDACKCQVGYHSTDISGGACTAIKQELVCLFPTLGVGCDGTTTCYAIVGAAISAGKVIPNCITKTCECQANYHKTDTRVNETKCTALKMRMHCLVSTDDLACDGTSKRSAIATKTDGFIQDSVANCRSGLTETCKCAINYAKTATTSQSAKCKAAEIAQECLTNVTSTTDKACDVTTVTATYLNETMIPIVTAACSGTAILLSVSVAAAYLLILFEMFLQ